MNQRSSKQPKDGINMQNMKVPTISNNFALGVLLAGTFLICFIMILNVFLDMPLFIMGLNFIYKYQQSVPYSYYHTIQNALSTFAHPALIGAVLVIYYIVVNRKLLLIVHVSYFIFATYIIAILKQAFQQSRPIWYDSKINNWEWFCWKDFGNPSGHSFAVILLYEPIISDSIGYWKYRPWSYVLAILCVLVPISRMYLGVHSLNQILFGLSLGTVFLILYKYIYQKALYDLYWQFLLNSRRAIKLIGITLLYIITIIIPMIFYQINRNERPMLQKDITNLNKQCGTKITGLDVQVKMMQACALGCFTFGLFYGFVILSDEPGYRKYLLGLWAYESYLKVILKMGIYIVCAGLPFAVIYIGTIFNQNPYADYLLLCFAVTGAGLGLSYLAPIVSSKCNIMKLLPGSVQDYDHKFT